MKIVQEEKKEHINSRKTKYKWITPEGRENTQTRHDLSTTVHNGSSENDRLIYEKCLYQIRINTMVLNSITFKTTIGKQGGMFSLFIYIQMYYSRLRVYWKYKTMDVIDRELCIFGIFWNNMIKR